MLDSGQSWAYRARSTDALVEVVVLRLGKKRPARVLVRFVDDDFEGREEWVPPARLKVSWADVDTYREREARWGRVFEHGLHLDDPRVDAASVVFDLLIDPALARIGYREGGSMRVADSARLAAQVELDELQLTSARDGFMEDGELVVPWPVTETVAVRAAELHPDPVLRFVATEERRARHEAIHGHAYGRRREAFIDADICAEVDAEHNRPVRDLLREWCGLEAAGHLDELLELRVEIRRVTQLARRAIELATREGARREAKSLLKELERDANR